LTITADALRLERPPAGAVNRPRDQLLAGPRLAEDQHGGIRTGHELDRPEHFLHGGRAAVDFAEVQVRVEGFAEVYVLALELVGAFHLGDVASNHHRVRHAAVPVHAERRRPSLEPADARLRVDRIFANLHGPALDRPAADLAERRRG
jgi:hypothetical protein